MDLDQRYALPYRLESVAVNMARSAIIGTRGGYPHRRKNAMCRRKAALALKRADARTAEGHRFGIPSAPPSSPVVLA